MYLTRLELQGFKSFADKTVIEFGKNITSIVGPNGSGKSNISDAIRWVLGEQSVKNLRGSKFEDIIFSGTASRKKMGFAEVNLVLDNTQKLIDLDYSEITVSRRLFRNGTSEYFINMVPCRLKDIHEMFYDTGVGRTGYSVVGQGKIDEILSSRSEDRREVFEEASGITKYKLRKNESERKLENTEQNLVRIKDIISELELQLEPLSYQAEKARKYLDLRESLKKSEINLFVHNIKRLNDRNIKLDEDIRQRDELIQARRRELVELNEKEKLKFETTKDLDQKIKNASDDYHGLKSDIERTRAEIGLLEEKSSNSMENIKRLKGEIQDLSFEKNSIVTDTGKKKERIKYLEDQKQQFEKKLREYELRYEEISKDLGEDEIDINRIKDMVMDKMDLLSDKKNQLNNSKAYIASVSKRQDEIKAEVISSLSEKDFLSSGINEISKKLRDLDKEIEGTLAETRELKDTIDRNRKELGKLENENIRVQNEINYLSSRKQALTEMENNLEGYSKSVKEIVQKKENDPLFGHGIHGPLARLIEVSDEYTLPVEIALGQVLQNIVTDDEEAAKRAVAFLKDNDIGRATFLPVSTIKGTALPQVIKDRLVEMDGFACIASEAVRCKDIYRDILDSFLARTIIVDDLDHAVIISKKLKSEYRIVTREGDVVNRGGSITGGSIKTASSNLLARVNRIEELGNRIKELDNVFEEKKNKYIDEKQQLELLQERSKEKETAVNLLRINFVREQGELKQAKEKLERTAARIDMLNNESEQLSREKQNSRDEISDFEKQTASIEDQIRTLKETVESKNIKQKERNSERDILHQEITDHKISVNSVKESMINLSEDLEDLDKETKNIEESIKRADEDIRRAEVLISQNEEKNKMLNADLSTIQQRIIGKQTLIERLSQEKEDLEESIRDAYIQKEKIEADIEDIKDEKNRIEIRKVKCDAEIDTIKNRLWDEYELTFNNCEKTAMAIENAQKTQIEIEEFRNSIRELGDVNVNAIEDHIKTKERHGFLKTQHEDMIKASEDLRRVIREMETIMKKQFLEQFRKINEIFNQVFRELFLGGTASISLVDESNVLESAIDINVQPPGKKLQNMMLLSGGERAFTAIALLFAIIKLKDTPFCILDEIDAALDDPNVVRFSDYLQELTKRTQFILVTHRKGTMEASDVLYGVTVEEKGVSRIVSLDMNS